MQVGMIIALLSLNLVIRQENDTMNARQLAGITLLCALSLASAATGMSTQPLETIRQAAAEFIRSRITLNEDENLKIQVRQLDRRLRLAACPSALQVRLPTGFQLKSRTSVQVACNDSLEPWKIFVPLRIQRETLAWTAQTALPRGHRLGPQDLRQSRVLADLEQVFPERSRLIGKQLKQPVQAGQALQESWLESPIALRRGERVTLVAGQGRVQVRMTGEVLQNARMGEKVRVRNLSSGKKLEGWLVRPGEVQLGGPPPVAQQWQRP